MKLSIYVYLFIFFAAPHEDLAKFKLDTRLTSDVWRTSAEVNSEKLAE